MRLAVVVSHPIQYYAPLFRELARRVDLHVFFGQLLTPQQQARAGFGEDFDWDVDLRGGFSSSVLANAATRPGPNHFLGCDTPEIGAKLKAGQFDTLLVFGWYLKAFVQAIWAAKRLGMRVIVRGDSQLNTPRGALKRVAKTLTYPFLLRTFDAALYVGVQSRAYYEHYQYPLDRLFFSPHCVDTAWFSARATRQSGLDLRRRLEIGVREKVVLFAGKLIPLKRPLDIVEACATENLKGAHIIVAGSGELEGAMRQRSTELGVKLRLLGFQNQTQMPACYAAADVLVLSSSQETWGLVANEALACGTPIVVADTVGCAPDLAGDGTVGRTFPVGDVAALARAIADLLGRPPDPNLIAAKSTAYGVRAAADGVLKACVNR